MRAIPIALIALLVIAVSAATIAGKGEVTEFKDGDIEKWAQTFSVEVRETLIENWDWTGDNAAKISALEKRVAQLEAHLSLQQQQPAGSEDSPDGSEQGNDGETPPAGNQGEPETESSNSCTRDGKTYAHDQEWYDDWWGPNSQREVMVDGQRVTEYRYSRGISHCNNGTIQWRGAEHEWRRESAGSEDSPDGSGQGNDGETPPADNQGDSETESSNSCTRDGKTYAHDQEWYDDWWGPNSQREVMVDGQRVTEYRYSRGISHCNNGTIQWRGAEHEWRRA